MGAAGLGAVVFGLIGPLSRWFDERMLLLAFGIVPMIIGRCLMFPIGSSPHPPGRISCATNRNWNTKCSGKFYSLNIKFSVNCHSSASWIGDFEDCCTYCNGSIHCADTSMRTGSSRIHDDNYNYTYNFTSSTTQASLPSNIDASGQASDLANCEFSGCSYEWCPDTPRWGFDRYIWNEMSWNITESQ